MKPNHSIPAHPTEIKVPNQYSGSTTYIENGMSLEDYFAGQVLAGKAAIDPICDPESTAIHCYRVAREMMIWRNKPTPDY